MEQLTHPNMATRTHITRTKSAPKAAASNSSPRRVLVLLLWKLNVHDKAVLFYYSVLLSLSLYSDHSKIKDINTNICRVRENRE